ncbi:glucuronyl esterase domain-containing protein [Aureliella helgolandensis]|uniref:4-O-methyl-glucuronoyl methylesterase-like domain-containing protein n=1 Tax=Aureliella helgolandensis TaxID=2527968 RepID=A0A518G6Y8_9BACT|nr:acetylxylan esterase [Aureliella helgolandensis]QDV24353.1 hypothetical protein Q31a_26700 [Aureliella helgolandensis]
MKTFLRGCSAQLCTLFVVLLATSFTTCPCSAQSEKFVANYDESQVPDYELPPILDEVTAQADDFPSAWDARRSQLLQTFTEQMFGSVPTSEFELLFEKVEQAHCLAGKGIRQQWKVTISTESGTLPVTLLLYTPAQATGPVPTFLGLNFHGNHTIAADPEILLTESWVRDSKPQSATNHQASDEGRGSSSSRWPIELLIDNGLGLATAYYGEIDPDTDDQFENGIHALFPDHRPSAEAPDRWGSIAAWSWGLSRLLDCMEQIDQVDASKVVVIGHSRLGKTSLWAGATDPRFAATISNDSGCGGAALSRRAFGETVWRINTSFPHWFCGNFKQYNRNEAALPIDQHQLLALLAPRPLYVASASEDQWADPRGEFLSAKLASEVYERFELPGLALQDLPKPNTASIGVVSYHLREGTHNIDSWDWTNYVQFIKQLQ